MRDNNDVPRQSFGCAPSSSSGFPQPMWSPGAQRRSRLTPRSTSSSVRPCGTGSTKREPSPRWRGCFVPVARSRCSKTGSTAPSIGRDPCGRGGRRSTPMKSRGWTSDDGRARGAPPGRRPVPRTRPPGRPVDTDHDKGGSVGAGGYLQRRHHDGTPGTAGLPCIDVALSRDARDTGPRGRHRGAQAPHSATPGPRPRPTTLSGGKSTFHAPPGPRAARESFGGFGTCRG